MKINLYKVNLGQVSTLKQWGLEIQNNQQEALDSLHEENCLSEGMRMFSIGDDTYVVGVMCPEKGLSLLPHNPEREINKRHFKILEKALDLNNPIPLEDIYTLTVE